MSNRVIVLAGAMVFAAVLALMLGSRLAGQAAAIGFGVAVGVMLGVPLGVGTGYVLLRRGDIASQSGTPSDIHLTWDDLPAGTMMLTPEQGEALIALINQPPQMIIQSADAPAAQISPADVLPRPARRDRDISVVGGADLSQSLDE